MSIINPPQDRGRCYPDKSNILRWILQEENCGICIKCSKPNTAHELANSAGSFPAGADRLFGSVILKI